MARPIPVLVIYNDGREEIFSCVSEVAELWGCSSQGILYLINRCKLDPNFALRRSVIAIQNKVAHIERINDLNTLLKRGQ